MKETRKDRISRFRARKAELLGQIRALKANPGRNAGHKLDRLNAQVERVDAKIKELKGVSNANS